MLVTKHKGKDMPARRTKRKSAPRKCALNRARTAKGGCSRKIPCMGPDGGSLPYAKRGVDGHCRVKPCGAGRIMNHATGRCNSRKTSNGTLLALSKRYDDSHRFIEAYDRASHASGRQPATYYNQFDASRLQGVANYDRLAQGENIRARRNARAEEKYAKWAEVPERSFLEKLRHGVSNVTAGIFDFN